MELRVLQYYLAVTREQSISGAAESLHLSQPTLSRQLKDMEEELGKQLFIRSNRRITLTEEGMILRKRCLLYTSIEIDDLRVGGQCPCNGHALLLSAGKLIRIVIVPIRKPYLIQRLFSNLDRLLLRHLSCDDQSFRHVLESGLVAEQVIILKNKKMCIRDS